MGQRVAYIFSCWALALILGAGILWSSQPAIVDRTMSVEQDLSYHEA